MKRITDVKYTQPRGDERAGHDLGIDLPRDAAVMRGVSLRGIELPGISRGLVVLDGLVDLEAQVRHDSRMSFIGDVDQPRSANRVGRRGRTEPERVLVEFEQVARAPNRDRDRVLGDRCRAPCQPADLARVWIRLAGLDLAGV